MRTIWKFPLPVVPGGEPVAMPRGARIVHGAMPRAAPWTPTLWAEVDSDQAAEPRHFVVIGTGHGIPADAQHVATYFEGELVWHVYEIPTVAWVEWGGGDCPVLDCATVDIELRNGRTLDGVPPGAFNWSHGDVGDDIVRYRIAAEQPAA